MANEKHHQLLGAFPYLVMNVPLLKASTISRFGAEIAAMVAKEGFELLVSPIHRLGALDVPVPLSPGLENFVIN